MDTKRYSALPADEAETERLAILSSLELLDTRPEREFDIIVACARSALKCKVVLGAIEELNAGPLQLDLANFKTVNHRCGYLAGGILLKDTAGRLQEPYLADYSPARLSAVR